MTAVNGPTLPASSSGERRPQSDVVFEVDRVAVDFRAQSKWVRVVDEVSFAIHRGETLGLLGESGSGKTVTGLAAIGLVDRQRGRVTGSARCNGHDLLAMPRRDVARVRGSEIAMIFQEPRRSLDPAFSVGFQIAEVVRRHRDMSRREAWERAVEVLGLVGIESPRERAHEYPHQFSGGMCQRVMIVAAIVCEPVVLIADEPTTALDVTVQAEVLGLLENLQDRMGLAALFITHDLGVVARMCDRVAVMYAGQIVEIGTAVDVFEHPGHPYTAGLLAAIGEPDGQDGRFGSIPGRVPPPNQWPQGCRFAPRCPYAVDGLCTSDDAMRAAALAHGPLCVRAGDLELAGVRRG